MLAMPMLCPPARTAHHPFRPAPPCLSKGAWIVCTSMLGGRPLAAQALPQILAWKRELTPLRDALMAWRFPLARALLT